MKKLLITFLLFASFVANAQATREVSSPNGAIRLVAQLGDQLRYSVYFNNEIIVSPSEIDMVLTDGRKLSDGLARPQFTERNVSETIISPVPEKRIRIPDRYKELKITLRNAFTVIFRVYDDGVAYRIATSLPGEITVRSETAAFRFPANHPVYFPEVVPPTNMDIYHTGFEEPYTIRPLENISSKNLFFSPVLVAPKEAPKIGITESDLEDYPGMFLTGNAEKALFGNFAPYPAEETETKELYSTRYVSKRANFLAKTKGTRAFPWRVLIIAAQDKDLPANDLVYRLASPSRVADVSWVKPGKATDEWIITSNIFNVPFKSGINTATYKYYIDFAKRFGFERIMMDAGWSDNNDLFKINPDIDMDEIVAYAKSKGVGISMWTLALTLDKQLEPALKQFSKWGVDFVMTDFINRDDQKAVQFFYKIAEACARHKIMLMFHGAFKPAGFNRTFPHAVAREAVLGSEYNMWSAKATPEHNVLLAFIRMLGGPLDYEPGMLNNATPKGFHPMPENVMSLTTRTQQLAMFVVYESPIQFFAGNPSQGLKEPGFMELLGSIPTVWDTTRILDARLGDYVVTARKKGSDWFIGALNDSTARELSIPLDFLPAGQFNATICEDGVNADRYPADYRISEAVLTSRDRLTIRLAPGGGYMVRLRR
ncbi:glycoside hydrolase family 97 protein [Dyadobacter fermentans]|uniref:Putative alpha-glucosidase n=1 Tax=Dyadobacter fermentans (strain ATCC 700827 / DSM 18053 / CIP 107007 / KCTC 52180 / NS114) TaxID=471854 RepID=C6W680_DYAFD|nr:glycoside hydrolase family 97 protein [Dyadobacter fermentans]ACT92560.1 putative alpha-glucosidase [Dyadobacter fermentans DSM 18053]